MQISITMPTSWDQIPLRHRKAYLRRLVHKGEVSAALLLCSRLFKQKTKLILQSGSPDDIAALVDAVSMIDDTVPILPSHLQQHFEDSPLMIFVKCDEIYGYMRDAVEAADWALLTKYTYQLHRALHYRGRYKGYDKYIKKPMSALQQRRLRSIIPASTRYFGANKVWIHETYGPLLFSDDHSDPAAGINLGWHGTAMSVAESGTFGSLSDVYETDLHTILLYLVKKKQEAEAATSKIK